MDGLRYSPDDPYYTLGPVHTCLYIQVHQVVTGTSSGRAASRGAWCAVIRKPRSAWLEGTHTMDHGPQLVMTNAYTCTHLKEKYNKTRIKKHGTS